MGRNIDDVKIKCDKDYLKSLPGVLNLAIMVLTTICLILVQSSNLYGTSAGNWTGLLCIIGETFFYFNVRLPKEREGGIPSFNPLSTRGRLNLASP